MKELMKAPKLDVSFIICIPFHLISASKYAGNIETNLERITLFEEKAERSFNQSCVLRQYRLDW